MSGSIASAVTECATGSVWCIVSGRSGYTAGSITSLTDREIGKIKRLMLEKERSDRRNNVVIKGVLADKNNLKKWTEAFFKKYLDLDLEI